MIRHLRYAFSIMALAALVLAPTGLAFAGGHGGAHWGYEGEAGPAHWGDLSKDFEACKTGKSQSPIDITGAVKADLPMIETTYCESNVTVVNNGHAIQVNYDEGNTLEIEGKSFDLIQYHFHGPSENTVNGQAFPMEAHLVHKSKDGELAVIGVMMKEGKENEFLKPIWEHLPAHEGENEVEGLELDVTNFLPADRTYYRFSGSLTTPPCSEGVNWFVLATPVEVSKEQIEKFGGIFKVNARPVQPLHGRTIKAGG